MRKRNIYFIYFFVALLSLLIYIFLMSNHLNNVDYSEMILLPRSGIRIPYWLLIDFGYVIMPLFGCMLLKFIIDIIEIVKWYMD